MKSINKIKLLHFITSNLSLQILEVLKPDYYFKKIDTNFRTIYLYTIIPFYYQYTNLPYTIHCCVSNTFILHIVDYIS